jgi:4-methyl-5(b-hydroxyethyl)-thiazole monophosphate biosynthesis
VVIIPDVALDQVKDEEFDMVVLPGGQPGSDHLNGDDRILRLLQQTVERGSYAAAICAAPKVLASAGLLDGRQATSYPGVLDKMALPEVDVDLRPVVHDGQVITSRGPGTAMDFALELIRLLAGDAKRDEVSAALAR